MNTLTTDDNAFGFITALSGAILDGRLVSTTWNIDSNKVYLFSSKGLGNSTNPLVTKMRFLEGKASLGDTFITNTGLLEIGGVVSGGSYGLEFVGSATLKAQSPLSISENITATGDLIFIANESTGTGDDITLASNIAVTSQTGKVRFQAGDNISFLTGSAVTAFNLIEILADYGDNDPAGATVSLSAALVAPLIVIRGSNQDDTITLESGATTHGITVVEGHLGSDTLTNKIVSSDYSNPVLLFGDTVTTNYDVSTRVLTSLTTTTSGFGAADTLTNLGGFTVLVGGVGADILTGNVSADWAIGDEAQFDFIGNLIRKISSTGSGL